ncbi:MAG TPA: cupin domain-containing protein, partial [Thermoleophilaceae bacterium]|nr:cupin domain-containing protein [Thermoleophilaceae bacterium]
MVPEAGLEKTEAGLAPKGGGWFVLNARDARWRRREGRGHSLPLTGWDDDEARQHFSQLGVQLFVLDPGEPIGMYHWEADQEGFLVLSGEALLIVEGEERPLRQWDFVHCPPGTKHIILGAGEGPCVVLAAGAREHIDEDCNGGGYTVDE